MADTTCGDGLLRTDVLGRVTLPREKREALLDEFERGGISGPKFAALVGVKYQTFAEWVQRRRRERRRRALGGGPDAKARERKPVSAALPWVEVIAAAPLTQVAVAAADAVRVQLPGGAFVEIAVASQVTLAAALLKALQNSPSR